MRFVIHFAIVSGAALALAACDGGKKEDPNARAAGGEVQLGSISDAMIDLDKSTAQAPLVPRKAGKDADGDDAKTAKKDAEASGAPADTEPAPAPKPSASASASPASDN